MQSIVKTYIRKIHLRLASSRKICIVFLTLVIFFGIKTHFYSETVTTVSAILSNNEQARMSTDLNVFQTIKMTSVEHSLGNEGQPTPVSITNATAGELFMSPFIDDSDKAKQSHMTAQAKGFFSRSEAVPMTYAILEDCVNRNQTSDPKCFDNNRHSVDSCPYNNCRQTDNLTAADVVVFFVWRMVTEERIPKFDRPPHQRWVMWAYEAQNRQSQFAMLDLRSYKGQFNWTMTHRLDSDIIHFYGKLRRQRLPKKNYTEIVNGKRYPAAWFVSNCQTSSGRDEYVRRMQKIIDVHVFGRCGNYSCSMGHNDMNAADKTVCFPMLSQSYFFYLSFENSICKDYVTEKFFKIFGNVDVIPVVRGGADYKRFFPPKTFIDASDFRSPEELATFLLDLSGDKQRYLDMLKEKSRYKTSYHNVFCQLCEKMMTDNGTKSYPDLRKWFTKDQCLLPKDL